MNLLVRTFRRLRPSTVASTSILREDQSFLVSDVVPATEPLTTIPYYEAVSKFLRGTVESCSCYHGELVQNGCSHPLIETLHRAFATHRPVELSPDIIWLTLTQGLARQVNENAEELRHHFVQHQGKQVLRVRRDDFIKGSPENPWPEIFAEFSNQIQGHIGAAHELIVADFSTTGPVERAASEVVLMDAMQAYFEYRFCTLCGIPSITLRGTVEDWKAIKQRVEKWSQFGLGWWVDSVLPILDQFVATSSGHVDRQFWDSVYKFHGSDGSGSPYTTGWVSRLFPYLYNHENKLTRNRFLNSDNKRGGPELGDFPAFPAKAPLIWEYYGQEFNMELIAGLIGIHQDKDTLCLRPEIGWVVREAQQGELEPKLA